MKRKIVLSLFALILFFTIGVAVTILYIANTTATLNRLIELHQIELLREGLVINLQAVQADLYTVHTPLGLDINSIVYNVEKLDKAAAGCSKCHHNPELTARIARLQTMVESYKNALSYYITASADVERTEKIKMDAAEIGNTLLVLTQDMTFTASKRLQEMTGSALTKIKNARIILFATLLFTFLLALWVSVHLTKRITNPINELLDSSRMIASGRLGYKTSYRDKTEFGELAESFNAMSSSLKSEREKIDLHIEQLSGLYNITLSFYKLAEMEKAFNEICRHIAGLIKAPQCILMLYDVSTDKFIPRTSVCVLGEEAARVLHVPKRAMEELFSFSRGLPIVCNSREDYGRFEPLASSALDEKCLLAAWLLRKEEILGVIRVSDKDGGFTDEDAKLLAILANHMAVAMENSRLYGNLQDQMSELKKTQEQLIQSAKLAAIGELASNVAHEINNPLTSILGFIELLKDETDIDVMKNYLDITWKETIRARNIVRELLNYARKRPLELAEVDINEGLRDVIPLVKSQAEMNKIELSEEYGDLPRTVADPNQLRQVYINIINNAVSAMPDGGRLSISTSRVGDSVAIMFGDTGHGIPKAIRDKIFEPFFSTKKDKGTGLGLPIIQRIVQEHGGKIDVESEEGRGSKFTVRLPLKEA